MTSLTLISWLYVFGALPVVMLNEDDWGWKHSAFVLLWPVGVPVACFAGLYDWARGR